MMTQAEKVRENRARRAAARQGLRLQRVRRSDPRALDYGRYHLIRGQIGGDVVSPVEGLTLPEVEKFLTWPLAAAG